jgi:hypothetical protein
VSLLARLRRVAERQVRGGDGETARDEAADEIFFELPTVIPGDVAELPIILAILGGAAAVFVWRRSKHGD